METVLVFFIGGHSNVDCSEQVRKLVGRGLDQKNLCLRRDCMCPFDVQRNFERPDGVRVGFRSGGIDFLKAAVLRSAVRQVEGRIEYCEILLNIRMVERIYNRNRLSLPWPDIWSKP